MDNRTQETNFRLVSMTLLTIVSCCVNIRVRSVCVCVCTDITMRRQYCKYDVFVVAMWPAVGGFQCTFRNCKD